MIHPEHKPLFDSIVSRAVELSVVCHNITVEHAKAEAERLLTEWWSDLLVKNIDKRAVKSELIRSIVIHTNEK